MDESESIKEHNHKKEVKFVRLVYIFQICLHRLAACFLKDYVAQSLLYKFI